MTEKHIYKCREWTLLIKQKKESGLTVRAWCAQTGHTKDEYYYWLRKLQKEHLDDAVLQLQENTTALRNRFVELPFVQQSKADISSATAEVLASEAGSALPAAVLYKNGIRIDLLPNASQKFLQALIGALDYAQA